MTLAPPRRNVAIFLDMENLFGGYSGEVANVPIRQLLQEIESVAAGLGVLSAIAIKRAYANWSDARLAPYRREMMEEGVEPVQVFSFGRNVKNAADIELVVDALSRAMESPSLDVFVLVTGDGGFVPLVRRLHALGRHVIVVTTEDSEDRRNSKLLKAVADHFHVMGDPIPNMGVRQPASRGAPQELRTVTAGVPTDEEALDAVRAIVDREPALLSNGGVVVNSALLGIRLRALWPEWSIARSRFRNVTTLAQEALGRTLAVLGAPSSQGPGVTGTPTLTSSDMPEVATTALCTDQPRSKGEFRSCLQKLTASPSMQATLQPEASEAGFMMVKFAHLLRRVAPSLDYEAVGFPTLKLALRFGLVGSDYCLVESMDGTDYRIMRRANAVNAVPDLDDATLTSPATLREVLAKSKPSYRFDSQEATTAVASFLSSPDGSRPSGRIGDLLEEVSEEHPDVSAEALRIALGLHVVAGVLRGDEAHPLPERHLEIDPTLTGYEPLREHLRSKVEETLRGWQWPHSPEDLEALLPPL